MKTLLKDCILTHQDSEVLRTYDISMGSETYHLGIDIKASDIYCPCSGVVIYDGLVEYKPSCTIQYSANICLRFTNMLELNVVAGQLVSYDTCIGKADEYVHFEYLTSEPNDPNFRVFFNSTISYYMYKHDPMLVLTGNIQFDNTPVVDRYIPEMESLYEDVEEDG